MAMPNSGPFTLRRGDLAAWLLSAAAFAALGGLLSVWYGTECEHLLALERERQQALSKILVRDIGINLRAIDSALAGIVRDRLADRPRRSGGRQPAHDGAGGSHAQRARHDLHRRRRQGRLGRPGRPDRPRFFAARLLHHAAPARRPGPFYLAPPFRSIRGDIVVTASRMVPGATALHRHRLGHPVPRYFTGMLRSALYAPDVRAAVARRRPAPSSRSAPPCLGPRTDLAPRAGRARPVLAHAQSNSANVGWTAF